MNGFFIFISWYIQFLNRNMTYTETNTSILSHAKTITTSKITELFLKIYWKILDLNFTNLYSSL